MRKAEIIFGEDVLHPRTKASVVLHENRTLEDLLKEENQTTSSITQTTSIGSTGLGDDVDLSFCVQDGFYESATLHGKTLVNCIQESSSQNVVLPYEFTEGQRVMINDTKESGALGVELKGQTLVNCLSNLKRTFNCSAIENGFTFNVVDNETKALYYCQTLKPNTEYTFFLVSSHAFQIQIGYDSFKSTGWNYIPLKVGLNNFTLTTSNDLVVGGDFRDAQGVCLRTESPSETISITHLMIIEGNHVDKDYSHFTGIASCKMPTLHTVGKNLFDGKFELGSVSMDNGQEVVFDGAVRTSYIKVKPNTTYSISRSIGTTVGVRTYNKNKKFVKSISLNSNNATTFTTPNEVEYIRFALIYANNDTTVQAQLEEGSNATSYEAHKSSILSLPEEVVLRSLPNGVCDTFNTRTGVYTQRIWSTTFNGTESYSVWGSSSVAEGMTGIYTRTKVNDKIVTTENQDGQILCDTLPTIHRNQLSSCQYNSVVKGNNYIGFTMKGKTSDEIKQWLSENPTTVYCELKTPVVTKINLPSTLKSWNTTTHIYSEIPENSLYPILSHSNPSYPVILKPSTKYSIVANSYGNSHTNSAINFNLGGATASTTVGNRVTTVTTPSALSNELLTMSGRGNKLNNVMVIEGDVVGDEPYFEGICDCKSPILLNVGKNLFDVDDLIKKHSHPSVVEITKTHSGFNMKSKYTGVWHATNYSMQLKPNTQYIFNCIANTKSNTGSIKLWNDCESFRVYRDAFLQNTTNLEINITFTTQKDGVVKFQLNTTRDISALGDIEVLNVSLYELANQTTYEPYKSNTTTFEQKDDKTIVLRSLPSGVCDTLNVETGEYVQRIGEIVLDGSYIAHSNQSDSGYPSATSTAVLLNLKSSEPPQNRTAKFVCKELPHYSANNSIWMGRTPVNTGISGVSGAWDFCIRLPYTVTGGARTDSNDVIRQKFKDYLNETPVTVQYELATPIVTTIDVKGFPYAYKEGHVILSSGDVKPSLTPKLEYIVQANRTGTIQSNQDRLINHEKRLNVLEAMVLHQLVQLEYSRAKCMFLSRTRQIFEGGIQMYHTKYDLLLEFIEKKLYRSLEEVFEMLDVYFMLGDITDGEYGLLYELLVPSQMTDEIPEEDFDYEYAGA